MAGFRKLTDEEKKNVKKLNYNLPTVGTTPVKSTAQKQASLLEQATGGSAAKTVSDAVKSLPRIDTTKSWETSSSAEDVSFGGTGRGGGFGNYAGFGSDAPWMPKIKSEWAEQEEKTQSENPIVNTINKALGFTQDILNYDMRSKQISENEAHRVAIGQKNENGKNASIGEIIGNGIITGMAGAQSGFAKSVDFLIPTDFLGKYDPFSTYAEYKSKNYETLSKNQEYYSSDRGKSGEIVSNLSVGTGNALMTAVMALLNPGAGAAASSGLTGGASTLSSTISSGLKSIASNPMYWNSFLSTVGNEYEEAKKAGGSDWEASLAAITSSLLNSVVEIGGGIETLPGNIKLPGVNKLLTWFKSGTEEGAEEVIQRLISGVTQKAIADPDKQYFSLSDESAIVNPKAMATDFGYGTGVGLVLGGGQMLSQSALNRARGQTNTQPGQYVPEQAETPTQTQQVGNVQTVQPASVLDKAAAEFNQRGAVSNNTATAILNDPAAVAELQQNGLNLTDGMTQSQRRAAVKETVARMQGPDETFSTGAQAVLDVLNGRQEAAQATADTATAYQPPEAVQTVLDVLGGRTTQEQPTPDSGLTMDAMDQQTAQTGETTSVGAAPAGFEGDTVSKFNKNLATDRARVEAIREDARLDPIKYNRLANASVTDAAFKILEENGFDGARGILERNLSDARAGKKLSPEMVPLSKMVMDQLAREGEYLAARNVRANVTLELVAGGQLINAGKLLRDASPEERVYAVQKSVDQINEYLGNRYGKNLDKMLGKSSDGTSLTQNEVNTVLNTKEDVLSDLIRNIQSAFQKKKNQQRDHGLPVSEWGRGIGEMVAKRIESRVSPKPKKARPVSDIIASDLMKFAEEHALPSRPAAQKRTAVDRLRDYFANRKYYSEAWTTAKNQIREKYSEDPAALDALEGFLSGTIDYNAHPLETEATMVSAILSTSQSLGVDNAQTDARLSLGDKTSIQNEIANELIAQTGAEGPDAQIVSMAVERYLNNRSLDMSADKIDKLVRSALRENGYSIADARIALGDLSAMKSEIISDLQQKYNAKFVDETLIDGALDRYINDRDLTDTGKKVDKIVQSELRELGVSISNIMRRGGGDKMDVARRISGILVERYGISEEVSFDAAQSLVDSFNQQVADRSYQALSKKYGARVEESRQAKTMMQKFQELSNMGAFTSEFQQQAIEDVLGIQGVQLTQDEIRMLMAVPDGDEAAFQDAYVKIAQRIGREMPSTMWEKMTEVRRIAMLANPTTQIRNLVGNVPMAIENRAANRLSGLIQSGMKKAGLLDASAQTRTATVSKTSKDLSRQLFAEKGQEIMASADKWDMNSMMRQYRKYFGNSTPGKALDAVRDFTYSMMEKGDQPFFRNAFIDSAAQIMEARGIKNYEDITQDVIDFATKNAMESTFKDATAAASMLNKIKEKGGVGGAALDIIIPFTTTPINITRQSVKYSPAGFLDAIYKGFKGDKTGMADALARALTGSAGWAIAVILAKMGVITGAADDDPDKRNFDIMVGDQAFSFGGKISYDWAQPFASHLAAGAAIYEAIRDNENLMDAVTNAAKDAGDVVLDMSVLSNVQDLFSGYGSPSENIVDTLFSGIFSQSTPSIVGQLARAIDPTVRSSVTGGNSLESALTGVMAKVPGLSQQLPASVDQWGRDKTRVENPALRLFDEFLNPANLNTGKETAVDTELLRLSDALEELKQTDDSAPGQNTVFPSVAPYDVDGVKLSGEERAQYQRTMGQAAYNFVSELVQSEAYQNASDKDRAKQVARAYALANAMAMKEYDQSYDGGDWEKALTAIESGVEPSAWFAADAALRLTGGSSSNQADYTEALESVDGLTDDQKASMWAAQSKDWKAEKNPYTGTLAQEGLTPMEIVDIIDAHKAASDMDLSARDQAAEFSKALDSMDLTDDQYAAAIDTYGFGVYLPVEPSAYDYKTMNDTQKAVWDNWGSSQYDMDEFLELYRAMTAYDSEGNAPSKAESIEALYEKLGDRTKATRFYTQAKKKWD